MKKILISGIAGFIGQNLSRALLAKGWKVFGIDNLLIGKQEWLHKDIDFLQFDVCDKNIWTLIPIEKFNIIVHLAARQIPRQESAYKLLVENTQGFLNIANYSKDIHAKFIYLSTSDVYGKNVKFSEDSDSIIGPPQISRWSYSISKMWGEQLLYSLPADFTFNIIRLFNTYGQYDAPSLTSSPISIFIQQALKRKPITIHGDGNQERAYQYIDDAINGIIRVIESDYNREIFNIGNPSQSISIEELSTTIWKLIHPEEVRMLEYVPPSPFKYEEIPFRTPDITKARTLLGFEPKITLLEGLEETIRWQRGVV